MLGRDALARVVLPREQLDRGDLVLGPLLDRCGEEAARWLVATGYVTKRVGLDVELGLLLEVPSGSFVVGRPQTLVLLQQPRQQVWWGVGMFHTHLVPLGHEHRQGICDTEARLF